MFVEFYSLKRANSHLEESFIEAASRVIRSGWYINGPEKDIFESKFAEYCDQRYAVGVGNGLDAITIALKALDVGDGDEVIVPAHTFIATWLGVEAVGATIVPVDVDLLDACINPKMVEQAITENTKAILAVNLYGNVCQLASLRKIADRHKLKLLVDSAQSHGASINNINATHYADVSTYSFYPSKNVGALGDAGAIVSNDGDFINRARAIANYGSHTKYEHVYRGVNSRLDEMQAAFLSIALDAYKTSILDRKRVAKLYCDRLLSLSKHGFFDILTPFNEGYVYHLFVLSVDNRDDLQSYLSKQGIESLIHYPKPVHKQDCYKGSFGDLIFPVSESLSKNVISLPFSPKLSDEEIDFICNALASYFGRGMSV